VREREMAIKRALNMEESSRDKKRRRFDDGVGTDWFDALHDDLVILILRKLSASADSPLDLINVMSRCDLHPL
jgi:hypothetical protein